MNVTFLGKLFSQMFMYITADKAVDFCFLISRKRYQKCIIILHNEFHHSLLTCSTSVKQAVSDCTQSCDMQQLWPVWRRDCLWSERTCSHKHMQTKQIRFFFGEFPSASILARDFCHCYQLFVCSLSWHHPVILKWTAGLKSTQTVWLLH